MFFFVGTGKQKTYLIDRIRTTSYNNYLETKYEKTMFPHKRILRKCPQKKTYSKFLFQLLIDMKIINYVQNSKKNLLFYKRLIFRCLYIAYIEFF